jgi:hypothetical protein
MKAPGQCKSRNSKHRKLPPYVDFLVTVTKGFRGCQGHIGQSRLERQRPNDKIRQLRSFSTWSHSCHTKSFAAPTMDSQKAPVSSVLERLTKGVRSMSPQHNRFHERLQSRSLFLDLSPQSDRSHSPLVKRKCDTLRPVANRSEHPPC